MPLTKTDLNNIQKIVKSETDLLMIKLDSLESRVKVLEMNNTHFHKELDRILNKLDRIREAEDEDFKLSMLEVQKLEKCVVRLEAKTA